MALATRRKTDLRCRMHNHIFDQRHPSPGPNWQQAVVASLIIVGLIGLLFGLLAMVPLTLMWLGV